MRRSPLVPQPICGTVLLTLVMGCGGRGDRAAPPTIVDQGAGQFTIPETSPLRTTLAFDTARTVSRGERLELTASVESDPARTVRLLPPFTGRVISVLVHAGDAVARGATVITMDSPDFTSAQADYVHALTAYHQASNNLDRERDLAKYGIAAQRDVDQAATDFAQAQGDLRRAASRLSLVGIDTAAARLDEALVVRSPVAGRVTDLSAGVGELRNDPTIPLMTIADLSVLYLTVNVPEEDIHGVEPGERASAVVSAYPLDTIYGTVSTVTDVVDTATRVLKARIRVANPGNRLKPGMFARVTVVGRPGPAVVVPATALLRVRDSTYVFVETTPWILQRRAVTPGEVDNGLVVVHGGIQAGERLVARQVVLLQ